MKQHLNTLFVQTQKAYLAKEGEAVLVRIEKRTALRVPIHGLGGIVTFGRIGLSPALMGLCGDRGVAISLCTEHGRLIARVNGFTSGNVRLRREQYRRADDPAATAATAATASIAAACVGAKVANGRSVLLRNLRDYPIAPGREEVRSAAARMALVGEDLARAAYRSADAGTGRGEADVDRVRGLEGEASAAYFGAFDHLVTAQTEAVAFTGRSRRPPLDPINALMSFLHATLSHDARNSAEAAGLDPEVGFLHRDRSGRAGLALDLMEELRPVLADRLALSLINRKQVAPGGFERGASGGVNMNEATRRAVLAAYQKRKQEEVLHLFLGERTTLGLVVHLQARLLAWDLRGDSDAYAPFV